MTARLLIAGRNSEIPATAFRQIGRGLASAGTAAPSRSIREKPLVSSTDHICCHRGGGRPQNVSAADLCFWFLCVLIFVATPVWIVVA